jgi:hypothetical protein
MSNAFDGAGKPSREPSYRAALIMVLLLLLVVAGLLLAASGALKGSGAEGINTQIDAPQLQSP